MWGFSVKVLFLINIWGIFVFLFGRYLGGGREIILFLIVCDKLYLFYIFLFDIFLFVLMFVYKYL